MQISMKCSVAVHCLIFIHEAKGIAKVTSNLLAESTGSNPVVIRNILSALKKAGLITVPRGTGGAELCADPSRSPYTKSIPHWSRMACPPSSEFTPVKSVPAQWRRIFARYYRHLTKKLKIPFSKPWKESPCNP